MEKLVRRNDKNLTYKLMETSYMKEVSVPCFIFNNYIVWGATAMMLAEIKDLSKLEPELALESTQTESDSGDDPELSEPETPDQDPTHSTPANESVH